MDITEDIETMFGKTVSENSIRNCILALAENGLQASRAEIMEAIRLTEWIGIDETVIIINGKRGYVWLVRTDRATYVVVTPSRSAQVIPTFFAELIGKKAKVDGYQAYKQFFEISRCWSHELLHAERLAIREAWEACTTSSLTSCGTSTIPP